MESEEFCFRPPITELSCRRWLWWQANDALDRFMDNLRSGDSGDLTFNELYIKISQPRHAWLVTILGEVCAAALKR